APRRAGCRCCRTTCRTASRASSRRTTLPRLARRRAAAPRVRARPSPPRSWARTPGCCRTRWPSRSSRRPRRGASDGGGAPLLRGPRAAGRHGGPLPCTHLSPARAPAPPPATAIVRGAGPGAAETNARAQPAPSAAFLVTWPLAHACARARRLGAPKNVQFGARRVAPNGAHPHAGLPRRLAAQG
ncbi:MAG: hypothetical protein J3K34DRAFT_432210, partial [Monoraphidium minutum]